MHRGAGPQRLFNLEPVWLLMLGIPILLPGHFTHTTWQPWVVAGIFLFWPIRWLEYQVSCSHSDNSNGRFSLCFCPLQTPISLSALLLLVWVPVTLWASVDRTTSWVAAGYLLYGIAVFVALVNWAPVRSRPDRLAWLLMGLGVVLAVAMPPIVAWKPEFRLFYVPFYDWFASLAFDVGEEIHANILAGPLVIILPLFAAVAIWPQTRAPRAGWWRTHWPRLLAASGCLLVGTVIVLTQSRGGYLALVAGLALVTVLRWPRLLYLLVPAALLAGFALVLRTNSASLLDQFSSDGSLGGWAGRLDIWTNSLSAVHDFVFTGIGLGTFTQVMPLLYPLQFDIAGYPHAHNLLLQVGVDMGVPGLLAWLSIQLNLMLMLILTWRTWRTRARSDVPGAAVPALYPALTAGAAGGWVAMHVHGLLDAATWGVKLAFIPWLLYALIALLYLAAVQNSDTTAPPKT